MNQLLLAVSVSFIFPPRELNLFLIHFLFFNRVMATLFYDGGAAVSSSTHQEEMPRFESLGQIVPIEDKSLGRRGAFIVRYACENF